MNKKVISFMLAAALGAAAFTGCASSDDGAGKSVSASSLLEIAEGAACVLEEAVSISSRLTIDLAGSYEYEGETSNLSMTISCDTDKITGSANSYIYEYIVMDYDDDFYEEEVEVYTVSEDEGLNIYTGYDGAWIKSTTEDVETEDLSSNIFREIANGTLEASLYEETVALEDEPLYVISLSAEGSYIETLVDFSVDGESGLFGDIDYSEMTMDIVLYIYEETLQTAMVEISSDELGEAMFVQLTGSDDLDFSVSAFEISCEYSAFNELSEITVPAEVADEAEEIIGSGLTSTTDEESSEAAAAISALIEAADEIIYDATTDSFDFDFEITVAGTTFTVPTAYTDLTDAGWIVDSSASNLVDAGDYNLEYMNNGSDFIMVYIYNPGSEECEYDDCYIVGIDVMEEDADEVSLSAGISISESTIADVIEAYGKPATYFVGDSLACLFYTGGESSLSLYFDVQTQVLNEIDMMNIKYDD